MGNGRTGAGAMKGKNKKKQRCSIVTANNCAGGQVVDSSFPGFPYAYRSVGIRNPYSTACAYIAVMQVLMVTPGLHRVLTQDQNNNYSSYTWDTAPLMMAL